MDALRKVALLLHGLESTDCRWLLARIEPERADRLADLLAELELLGIPREPLLLEQLDADADRVGPGGPVQAELPGEVRALLEADVEKMARLLAAESDSVIARVLACHDWPWRGAVLGALPESRRRTIGREATAASRMTRRARGALLLALGERLQLLPDEVPAVPATVSRRSGWRWWWPRRLSWLT